MNLAKRWFWFFFLFFVAAHFIPFVWVGNSSYAVECSGFSIFPTAFQDEWNFSERPVRTLLQVMAFCIIFVGALMIGLCCLQTKTVRSLTYVMLHKKSLDNSLLLIILIMFGIGLLENNRAADIQHLIGFHIWVFSSLGMTIANRWIDLEEGDIPEIGLEIHLVE